MMLMSCNMLMSQIHHLPSWMPLFRSSFSHPTFRLWHLTGGVWGAVFVTVSIVLVEQIGFALYFVASVAGQVSSTVQQTQTHSGHRRIAWQIAYDCIS